VASLFENAARDQIIEVDRRSQWFQSSRVIVHGHCFSSAPFPTSHPSHQPIVAMSPDVV
jgi:hypothetical protein